jgi:hypothetical protein
LSFAAALDSVLKEALGYFDAAGELSNLRTRGSNQRRSLLSARAALLIACAKRLGPRDRQKAVAEALQDAIRLAKLESSDAECCRAVEGLAPLLSGKPLEEALRIADGLRDFWRKYARAALAPMLPADRQRDIWASILDDTLSESDQDQKRAALVRFAPHCHEAVLDGFFEAALALKQEQHRSSALLALAPRLAGNAARACDRGSPEDVGA